MKTEIHIDSLWEFLELRGYLKLEGYLMVCLVFGYGVNMYMENKTIDGCEMMTFHLPEGVKERKLTIITMLCIRSPELIHLLTTCLYPLTNISVPPGLSQLQLLLAHEKHPAHTVYTRDTPTQGHAFKIWKGSYFT